MDSKYYEANDDLYLPPRNYKLCFVTGIWKRHDVFKMFAEGVKVLQDHFKHRIEIHCCVSGSEGALSRNIVLHYSNFHYIEVPNQPLGAKMNAALVMAKSLGPDYCLMVGSDDLIGISLMRKYLSIMEAGTDYASLLDCYFYDLKTKKALYWGGYTKFHNKGHSAGIGKLISSRLLDRIQWNCFPPGYDKILDTGFERALSRVQYSKVEINLQEQNLFALDIKSTVNMTPFAQWDNSKFVNGRTLLFNNLPQHLAELIYGK